MSVIRRAHMVVQILRDAKEGDRGWDKNCKVRQVHILLADNSTTVAPISELTEDDVPMASPPEPRPVIAPVVMGKLEEEKKDAPVPLMGQKTEGAP